MSLRDYFFKLKKGKRHVSCILLKIISIWPLQKYLVASTIAKIHFNKKNIYIYWLLPHLYLEQIFNNALIPTSASIFLFPLTPFFCTFTISEGYWMVFYKTNTDNRNEVEDYSQFSSVTVSSMPTTLHVMSLLRWEGWKSIIIFFLL